MTKAYSFTGLANGTYTVTLDGGASVHSLTLGGTSGTQTLSIDGSGSGTGVLHVATDSSVGANGVVDLSSVTNNAAWWDQTGGTLTNNGTISVLAGAGGSRFLYGTVVNGLTGSVQVGSALTSDGPLAFTNNGSVTVPATWTISGGGSFTNAAGSVVSSGGGELFVVNGSYVQGGGGASGSNPVRVVNGNLSFTGSGAATVAQQASGLPRSSCRPWPITHLADSTSCCGC